MLSFTIVENAIVSMALARGLQNDMRQALMSGDRAWALELAEVDASLIDETQGLLGLEYQVEVAKVWPGMPPEAARQVAADLQEAADRGAPVTPTREGLEAYASYLQEGESPCIWSIENNLLSVSRQFTEVALRVGLDDHGQTVVGSKRAVATAGATLLPFSTLWRNDGSIRRLGW